MSGQYSRSIKPTYFDPRTHINNRSSEFRLDTDRSYLPNLRLANVGFQANANTQTPQLVGFLGIVKHIRLMDGGVELSSLRFANRYISWLEQLGNNQDNLNLKSALSRSRVGYMLNSDDKVEHPPLGFSDSTLARNFLSEAVTGYLDLRHVFPILNELNHLDTKIFKSLKVVIEYEDRPELILENKGRTHTTHTPILIADEITDPAVAAELSREQKNVVWNEVEHDQFLVPDQSAVAGALATDTATSKQTVSAVVNGFDNKHVSRVVLMKEYSDLSKNFTGNSAIKRGPYASQSQDAEALQVRINGANIFPANGIDSPSKRAMKLAQAWGKVNIVPFSNVGSVGLDDFDAAMQNDSGVPVAVGTKQSPTVGQSDYIGFSLEEKVRQLNFTYSRVNRKDTNTIQKNNLGLNVHVYGEVRKGLNFASSGYNVSYV